jgi:hypothetical protein
MATTSDRRCPCCGCSDGGGAAAHLLQGALMDDDLDRAMGLGLVEDAVTCPACSTACRASLLAARHERQRALAARERFRARALRLERLERERALRRKPPTPTADVGTRAKPAAALPPAAAAALARARAKAAGRTP